MNKNTALLLLTTWILGAACLQGQTSTLAVVEENGSRGTRLNMVFLSEGYTSGQMGAFASDVQTCVDFLFTKEPWVRYRSYCNIYRVEIASNQSGTDNGEAGGSRDTYFQTGFNTPGIPQLNTLAGSGSSRAYSLLNKHVPEYDIPIVLINDSTYGGSGGPLALATTNEYSAGILEHELGHSFARLTDEYDEAYAGYPATEYPNATARTQRSQIRWNAWIDAATPLPTPENDPAYADPVVGLFEGANYRATGWYRPHDNALMRNLLQPPGSVTREAFILTYYGKISLIDAQTPASLRQTITSKVPLSFSLTLKSPSTGPALTVRWLVDDIQQEEQTTATFNIDSEALGNGSHKVKAVVRDPTPWVRRDPTALLVEEITWSLTLSNQVDPPVITNPLPASPVVLPLYGESGLLLDATATGPGPITYEWLKNNKPLKPAVTTPVLSLNPVFMADAGTYTVKVKNPGHTVSQSVNVVIYDGSTGIYPLVVGEGKTATFSFVASSNLPPTVQWDKGVESPVSNGGRISGANTSKLVIKQVTQDDAGNYFFTPPGSARSGPLQLQVVSRPPDYTGIDVTLPEGRVGLVYDLPFPLPTDPLRRPNSFSARLPAGLTIHPKDGYISGKPTVPSKDQVQGDEVAFTIGNEFGKVTLKTRLLIRPLPEGVAGSFTGLVHRGSELGGDTGGRIDFTIQPTGSYSGKAVIGPDTLSFNGGVDVYNVPPSTMTYLMFSLKPRHLDSPLAFSLQIKDAGDEDPTTSAAEEPGQFFVWRNKWLPPEASDDFKGYSTFGIRVPTDEGNVPRGHGFGSISVDAKGLSLTAGRLADGESFTCSAFISPQGEVPLYQTLYTTPIKGSVLSVLSLPSPLTSPDIQGMVSWMRPASDPKKNRVYASGFPTLLLNAFGRTYSAPDSKTIPMGLSAPTGTPPANAALNFDTTLGDDPLPVQADVTLAIKAGGGTTVNKPNLKNVSFSLTPATGAFKGSYTTKDNDPRPAPPTRPQVSRKVDYQGLIVNDNGTLSGVGFFLRDALPKADGSTTPTTSPKDSGKVLLNPAP
ncbi:MAG: hypothetical protein CJBNEKGG_02345 [Prosthecobacter sp.]|nr:hypothetical protein [Prosthecobacter sp.]